MKIDVLERINLLIGKDKLGEWDTNFLHSLKTQVEKRGSLSEKQIAVLSKVEARYTVEAVMARIRWEDDYDNEKREIARVCAEYYRPSGYYRELSHRVLTEEDFIPTEKQWNAMCNNKYAMKVRDGAFGAALYPVGAMVKLRKSPPGGGLPLKLYSQKIGTDLAVVISDNEPIVSSSRGNRRYKILFVGDSTPQLAEERDIKKLPKKYQKK
jgi:hypothetical protein